MLKKGIIQTNIHRILWKINQVIYIMYQYYDPSSSDSPDFVYKVALLYKIPKSEKRHNLA